MNWLKGLIRRKRIYGELRAEIEEHLAEKVEELVAGGISRTEAAAAARREFGNVTLLENDSRAAWRWPVVENLFSDLGFALRSLAKSRGFAFTAVFTLALGIGATTAMFSVVYNLLFNPFPYKAADRLAVIQIRDLNLSSDNLREEFTIPEFLDYRRQNHVFEDLVGGYATIVPFDDGKSTRTFGAVYVTGNTFEFYGIPPLLGRGISPEDAKPGAPPVFVMNYNVWNAEFSADTKILGKSFLVEGEQRTLVGVMPPRFEAGGRPLWFPLILTSGGQSSSAGQSPPVRLWTVGRLKPGTSPAIAAAELGLLARSLSKLYPKEYPEKFTVEVQPLAEALVGNFRGMLYSLLGAVLILLSIACGNVANLLLARASTREREIAVRVALGASPGRIVRQLLAETLLLSAFACLGGCLLAYLGLKGISAVIPSWLVPREAVIGLSPFVFGFAVAVSLLTTLLCCLAPAVHALRANLHERLAASGKSVNAGTGHGTFRSALVVAEVALSVVLLSGAGLLLRSFLALTRTDLGFKPDQILFTQFTLPQLRPVNAREKKLLFDQLLPRVKALPGVVAVTAAYSLPPSWGHASDVTIPGRKHAEHWYTRYELCSSGYLETLGLQLLKGRGLSESDVVSASRVAVVNQTLARRFFPGLDPIGQTFKLDNFDQLPDAPHDAYFEIIGVVKDFSNWDVREPSPLPEALLPFTLSASGERILMARTAPPPDTLLPAVRREIWAVDPKLAVTFSGTLLSLLEENSFNEPWFDLLTSGGFAGVGLLLVVVGVFSVMAYTVSLRTHEIGIRVALGAAEGVVLKMVLAKGLKLIAAGLGIGLAVSFALARYLASQIWGVSWNDPATFLSVVGLVAAAGSLACLLPARRAARVDPLVALRYE